MARTQNSFLLDSVEATTTSDHILVKPNNGHPATVVMWGTFGGSDSCKLQYRAPDDTWFDIPGTSRTAADVFTLNITGPIRAVATIAATSSINCALL